MGEKNVLLHGWHFRHFPPFSSEISASEGHVRGNSRRFGRFGSELYLRERVRELSHYVGIS